MYCILYFTSSCNVMLQNDICNVCYVVLSHHVYDDQMLSYAVLSLHVVIISFIGVIYCKLLKFFSFLFLQHVHLIMYNISVCTCVFVCI